MAFYLHNSESQVLQHFSQVLCVDESSLVIPQGLVGVWLLGFLSQNVVSTGHQNRKIFPIRFQRFIIFPDL